MRLNTVKITHSETKAFVERWHYSGRMPTGKNICFGWRGEDGLYAVAVYGIGVNPYQAGFLSRQWNLPVYPENLVELKRLCRVEPRRDNSPLTMFLSQCHKRLREDGYKYVVSFSDPEHNHNGGIYRAANFFNSGKSNPEFHLVGPDGVLRHRRFAQRHAERHNMTIGEARKFLEMRRVKVLPKDRWFLPLLKGERKIANETNSHSDLQLRA